jgi:hypothetical protein
MYFAGRRSSAASFPEFRPERLLESASQSMAGDA